MALTQAEINEVMQQLQPIIAKALNESTSIEQAQANIQQGVTQYIGARYVPIFADPIEWDNKRAYEPLTIVLYQGNSFTTRQYTPAGIDINNEAFWAETGNYNAQIEQYRRELEVVKHNITDITNDISTINNQLSGVGDSGLKELIGKTEASIKAPTKGFTLETGYDMDSRCQWKKFTFPKSMYPLDKLKIDLALEENIPERNYYKWLASKTEGIYFNGALQGAAVSNGQVVYASAPSNPEYWYLLLIKDGVVSVRKDTSHLATAHGLVSEGYEFACCVWLPVVLDGVKFNVSSIPTSDKNYDYIISRKHPRTMFAWDDDNWYVVVIEGRGYINLGANFDEMYAISNSLGLTNVVNMDGGHSSQVWSTAPTFNYVYQNSPAKTYGFASGNIFAFISTHK